MLRRLLIAVLLLGTANTALSMDLLELRCKKCRYQKYVHDGATKWKASQMGVSAKVFFCTLTEQFVSLDILVDPEVFKKSLETIDRDSFASPTSQPVKKGSAFRFFTHKACENGLVPLQYYAEQKKPTCPVCGDSKLEISYEAVVD